MKKVKSYLIFTSVPYRVVMFFLVPLFLIGLGIYFGNGLVFPAEIFIMVLFPAIEVVADYMIFGGIASKKTERLEYLKTSTRGMQMLKDALTGGMFRMLLSEILVVLIIHFATSDTVWQNANVENRTILIASIFCATYFLSVLGITIERFITIMQACWVIASVVSMAASFAMVGCIKNPNAGLGIFLILSIAVSIFSIYIAMKRAKESYYDKAA